MIDHSVQVDEFGTPRAFQINADREFERNRERYAFLRWGQQAFDNFAVVPPDTGIVHQVNLEYLARVVSRDETDGTRAGVPRHARRHRLAHDDGQRPRRARLGRGRDRGRGGDAGPAGLDADPAGGRLPARRRAARGRDRDRPRADRHEMLRERGVVGKFVEFFGDGPRAPAAGRPRDDRQHGARVRRDLRDLPDRRRDAALPALHRPPGGAGRAGRGLRQEQGMFHEPGARGGRLHGHARARPGEVEPSLAGPRRPQDRVPLREAKESFARELESLVRGRRSRGIPPTASVERFAGEGGHTAVGVEEQSATAVEVTTQGERCLLDHGSVVIAAITSCTNTSNPSVMIAAGLLAKKAARARV